MYNENMTDSSNMTPDEVNERLKELEHQVTRLRNHNAELQHFLQIADEENTALQKEKVELGDQIKGLKQKIEVAEQLGVDLEESRNLATERQHIVTSSRNHIKALEKENKALLEQNGTFNSEMACVTSERTKSQERIDNLSRSLRDVQNLLAESQAYLNKKDTVIQEKNSQIAGLENSLTEYSISLQNIRQSKKELEFQLEKALLFPSQEVAGDGLLCAHASPQPMSLADELGLFSRLGMAEGSDEEADESSSSELEDVVEAEEKVKEEQDSQKVQEQEAKEEEKEQVVEKVQAKSWWQQHASSLVSGTRAAVAFTMGFLVPLGLLVSTVPAYDQTSGFNCANVLLTTSRYLVEPYCDVYHMGVHPF